MERQALVDDFLSACHVSVLLSPREGGEAGPPMSVLDGMGAGAVPIITNIVGARSPGFLIDGRNAFFFNAGDVDGAARVIQILWQDRVRLHDMAAACREIAAQLSVGNSMAEWVAHLDRVVREVPVAPVAACTESRTQWCASYPQGRLDRLALPAALVDAVRRLFRRWPRFEDGWGEWPGTLSAVPEPHRRMFFARMIELDEG